MFKRPSGGSDLSDAVKTQISVEAKAFARSTRERLGITLYEPLDIVEVTEREGILVFQIKDLGQSGFIRIFGQQKTIFVNASESLGRQYYTIAHELCHILRDLEHAKTLFDLPEEEREEQTKQMEYFAFKFADYFLMPEEAIAKCVFDLNIENYESITTKNVFDVQHYFSVSYVQALRMLRKVNIIDDVQHKELRKISSAENPELLCNELKATGKGVELISPLCQSRIPKRYMDVLIDNIKNKRMTAKKVKHLEGLLGINLGVYFPDDGSDAVE